MNKVNKLAILSILLLSGCSYSSMLSHRYENPMNNSSTNSSSYKIEFVVPNDGKGIKPKEFYTNYSDLYDYSYVLDNINKVEDTELKNKYINISLILIKQKSCVDKSPHFIQNLHPNGCK